MMSKINFIKLCTGIALIAHTNFVLAQTSQSKKTSNQNMQSTQHTQNTQNMLAAGQSNEYVTTRPKRHWQTEKRYNGSVWAGVGFLFTTSELQTYVDKPLIDYQIGVAKSIWNVTPYDFMYLALIADFAYSNRGLGTNGVGVSSKALYYFSNEQLLLGYEQTLGTKYFTGFLEAGVAFQQRYFLIQNTSDLSATDYVLGTAFGGTFNAGFNIRIVPERRVSYLFRLAMNVMIGEEQNTTLNFNGQRINVNSLTYGPSVSFGVRM